MIHVLGQRVGTALVLVSFIWKWPVPSRQMFLLSMPTNVIGRCSRDVQQNDIGFQWCFFRSSVGLGEESLFITAKFKAIVRRGMVQNAGARAGLHLTGLPWQLIPVMKNKVQIPSLLIYSS